MATVYYSYNETDLYLSNSDLSNDATYGTAQGYTCGTYTGTNSSSDYNKSTCTTITILNTIQPDNCSYYFYNFTKVTTINNLFNLDTSNVTDMGCMFYRCSSLTSLDLSSFNTSNVTDMGSMFCRCDTLTSLDLSNFDTSNVTLMASMFDYSDNLTYLDLSSFNTSKVESMYAMFRYLVNMTSLNLSNFDTSNVTNMWCMFGNCESLTMLDLSSFNTSKVTNMAFMFNTCKKLQTILSNDFDTSSLPNIDFSRNMFIDCTNLVGAIAYDETKVTADYANTTTGYFKYKRAKIKTLETTDNIIYPLTVTEAIYNLDGTKLANTLKNKQDKLTAGSGIIISDDKKIISSEMIIENYYTNVHPID